MADLTSTAVKSAASGSLTATTVGIDPVTMAVGLIAALVALLHVIPPPGEARTPLRVFALVVGSGFLAGVFVPVAVAGGGGGGIWDDGTGTPGAGGSGGGGAGAGASAAVAGTANTGGGGGGGGTNSGNDGAAGGSGVVIIRYKFQ